MRATGRYRRLLSAVALSTLAVTSAARAEYNATVQATVKSVITYDNGLLLFKADSHRQGICQSDFVVPAEINSDALHQMLSRLLAAHAARTPIEVGYDAEQRSNGRYKTHRVG